ncbi:MAG: Crp/Fnr family transcriptional regulator [Deltaproteobacteria bacterium]|nr:MAG: Crp/Fnr family transcriptional regulator [Deltaproteobacteria bacterium]
MELIRRLATIPLFEGLPGKQHAALADISVRLSYEKGQKIFSEGDEGAGFFVILDGYVKIFKVSPEGKELIYHIFGPNESFGEVAVFTGHGFPAEAEAISPATALFFPRVDFVRLLRNEPSLALNMLAVLSWRLRKFSKLIEDLCLKEVPGRLAAYLIHLSTIEGNDVDLNPDVPKNQLAFMLGTIPETLSRIITRMTREGLIRTEGSRICIQDLAGLEDIVRGDRKLAQYRLPGRQSTIGSRRIRSRLSLQREEHHPS